MAPQDPNIPLTQGDGLSLVLFWAQMSLAGTFLGQQSRVHGGVRPPLASVPCSSLMSPVQLQQWPEGAGDRWDSASPARGTTRAMVAWGPPCSSRPLQLAGTWHSMAMAASDFSLLETKEAPLRIYISSLQPTPEGNLEIVLRRWSQKRSPFRESNQCIEEKIIAEKTENPIEFKINYLDENRIYLFNTDGSKYLFLCLESTPRQNLACQYLVRTLEVDDKVMAEFISFLKTLPVHMQIFLDMTQAEEQCRI
ncbi:PREDICTED: beta-lactoglobulin-1-like isoform X1 [Cercocebus atys]|uniref:beta-lactoglobulin-1-like isoform X1 n=1 Tax=Cercocebus atys TaxID=9531 RepID=UPI0005F42C42|nr:PREDICTED: beta-lactoglobulin-1-like isoform X1 [Cercocebus atys]